MYFTAVKKRKNQAAMNFIQQLQQRLEPKRYQKTAFLENHPDTITRIAEEMISNGVDQLIIVPVLLFAAKHALVDIPAELEVVKKIIQRFKLFKLKPLAVKQAVAQFYLSGSKRLLLIIRTSS
ncbi:CbiX/SirB N-terminal domain-containing protein [Enterococcus termitis]